MAKKILIISPHTDDGELGCGGTIAKFIEEGNEVDYVAFPAVKNQFLPNIPGISFHRK